MGGKFGWHRSRESDADLWGAGCSTGLLVPSIIALWRSGVPVVQGVFGSVFTAVLVTVLWIGWRSPGRPHLGAWQSPRGLTLFRWRQPRQHVAWRAITSVTLDGEGAVLRAGSRAVRLPNTIRGWAGLVGEAERHLADSQGERPARLADAEIERCFGLEPGGTIRVTAGWWSWLCILLACLPYTFFWWSDTRDAFGLIVLLAMLLLLGARHQRRVHGWRASAAGLELYAWRPIRLPWDDILQISSESPLLVETRQGDFVVGNAAPRRDELRVGLKRVMALRAAGAVLPRLSDVVPDTALSRAETVVADERGLSRSEGQA